MIKFKKVKLSRDLTFIYNIMTDYNESSLIMRRCSTNSFEQFEDWFKRELDRFYLKFFIIQNENDQNIGFIYAYDYSEIDRNAKISVYITPEYQNLGAGVIATLLFADRLFLELNLLRLYSYVYGYNANSIVCNQQAGLVQEGCLSQNRFYQGEFWDLYIFSISKKDFYQKYENMLASIRV